MKGSEVVGEVSRVGVKFSGGFFGKLIVSVWEG